MSMHLKIRTSIFLTLVLICRSQVRTADLTWPLRGEIDLASGFGDFRDGRFHAGVDLRTGGVIGLPVYSPIDGWVWRIKTSYSGYGKALYIKGKDNYIYVFGHLSRYAPGLDSMVMHDQIAAQRYALDKQYPADSLPITKGVLIAYSGQTGAGAPHLHFEKRLTDEFPLNPLRNGFVIKDKVSPVFTRLGFQLVDDHSLFENGKRELFEPAKSSKGQGQYVVDTIPAFSTPFGILVDGYDKMRLDGMEQAIRYLKLELDGRPVYESKFDTLSFAAGKSVYFEYDFVEATNGNKSVRRLFHLPENAMPGSRALDSSNGVIGKLGLHTGQHTVTVIAEDSFGNRSTLSFRFNWVPPATPLLALDSIQFSGSDSARFYFHESAAYDSLQIDSSMVRYNNSGLWNTPVNAIPHRSSPRHFVVETKSGSSQYAFLRWSHRSKKGGWIDDEPFNNVLRRSATKYEVSHELLDDGLVVTCTSIGFFGDFVRLALYGHDSLLGVFVPSRFSTPLASRFFVPPRPELRHVDSLFVFNDSTIRIPSSKGEHCYIRAVGFGSGDTLKIDSLCQFVFKSSDLFAPRFVELSKVVLTNRSLYRMNSDAYKLLPESFITKDNFSIRLFMNIPNDKSFATGLCRFDFDNKRWTWQSGTKFNADTLTTTTGSGGTFAGIFDLQPPEITNVSIRARETIFDHQPRIQFTLRDTVSGIEDDRSIDIRLDNKWMIPEYDPETQICTFQPLEALKPGDHHLALKITDRAGNLAQQFLIFTVANKSGSVGK